MMQTTPGWGVGANPAPALDRRSPSVRFTYAESMTDPDFYVPLAQAAERVGFDSMTIADSICYRRNRTRSTVHPGRQP